MLGGLNVVCFDPMGYGSVVPFSLSKAGMKLPLPAYRSASLNLHSARRLRARKRLPKYRFMCTPLMLLAVIFSWLRHKWLSQRKQAVNNVVNDY